MRAWWPVGVLFAFAFACGEAEPLPDAGVGGGSDAAVADAAGVDAYAATECGDRTCTASDELCVIRGPVGPGYTYACEPVPAGCEQDRGCDCVAAALCTGAFDTCSDGDADNTVTCECPACQ